MFNSNGYSLSDIAAVSGNNGRNGFGDGDYWWIILLFLFAGNWGWGGYGRGGAQGGGTTTREEISYGFDMNGLERGIAGIQQGLCDGFYAMNTSLLNGFAGTNNAITTTGYQVLDAVRQTGTATTAGLTGLGSQLAACCCDLTNSLTSKFADLNYNLASQACDTRRAITDSARDIIENNNANARQLFDYFTQTKINEQQSEIQALKFAASQANQNAFIAANQQAQTAELIRRLGKDCPVPAYIVPNPNCCYPTPVAPTCNFCTA